MVTLSPRAPKRATPSVRILKQNLHVMDARSTSGVGVVRFVQARTSHQSRAAQLSTDLDRRRTVRTAHTCHSRPSLLSITYHRARPPLARRTPSIVTPPIQNNLSVPFSSVPLPYLLPTILCNTKINIASKANTCARTPAGINQVIASFLCRPSTTLSQKGVHFVLILLLV
jgi:hypothetical protein